MGPIKAITKWQTNGHLIADCAKLGYLRKQWVTLDPTYGQGTFWRQWQPDLLIAGDLKPVQGAIRVDFTRMPWATRTFDCVVFDPPYKLNGTPDQKNDERYGIHTPTRWQDRMTLIRDGIRECSRVLDGGYLLLKCQDQVSSGKIRWQTYEFTKFAEKLGLGLVDRFDFLSYRPQPVTRKQIHARRNASTLLVFRRGYTS
jgi:hypothetical protein